MKVGLLVVLVGALVASVAPTLSSCAKTQKQKREAQALPEPTPTPSPVSATPANKPKPLSSEDPEWWDDRSIRSVNDARQFFEAVDGSHYTMMRDFPDRRDEYAALKIDEAQERQWRRAMIAKLSDRMLNPATDAGELWWLHSRLERMCEWQDDPESVLKIYEVTRRIAGRLPIKDGVIVAQTINGAWNYESRTGRTYHSYKTGLIYLAVKHGLRDVAQDLADYSMSLAQRAKRSKVDVEGAELAIEGCLTVKRHFRLR